MSRDPELSRRINLKLDDSLKAAFDRGENGNADVCRRIVAELSPEERAQYDGDLEIADMKRRYNRIWVKAEVPSVASSSGGAVQLWFDGMESLQAVPRKVVIHDEFGNEEKIRYDYATSEQRWQFYRENRLKLVGARRLLKVVYDANKFFDQLEERFGHQFPPCELWRMYTAENQARLKGSAAS